MTGSQYYLRFFNESGDLLWKYHETGYVGSVAISGDGGTIIAGSSDRVLLFDRFGHILWDYDTGGWSHVSAARNGNYFAVGTAQEIMFFNRWGNATVIDEPNLQVKRDYPNTSPSVVIPSTSKPAPLSYIIAIGALVCVSAFFSKKNPKQ